MSQDAVIVSTARTGVGKAYRGALNNTDGPTLAGHVVAEAVKRAGIAPDEVEDVVMGCAMQQGTMVMNVARKGAMRAGLPRPVIATGDDGWHDDAGMRRVLGSEMTGDILSRC
jgi:acetyl-CoA C-acetyltransferase